MKTSLKAVSIVLALGVASCSSPSKKDNNEGSAKEANSCVVELQNEGKTAFTSYKTNDKVAVGGEFKDVEFMFPNNGKSLTESLEGAQVRIATNSVNTGDSIRDGHIRNYFFGTMKGGDAMKGEVKSVTGNEEAGELSVFFNLNGLGENLKLSYAVEENTLVLLGTIDLEMWNALSSLASLNEQCFDLHKGPDGDSKLWQTVDVRIEIGLNKEDC